MSQGTPPHSSRCQPIAGVAPLGRSTVQAAIAVVIALAGCGDRSPPPPEGDILSLLALPLLDGGSFDPETVRGKNVLVNFWRPG